MRFRHIMSLGALSLTLCATQASAEQSDLVGTWTTETTILLESEGKLIEAPRRHTFVIEEVDGQLVRGYRTWAGQADEPGYVGDVPQNEAREPFIGTLSSDGQTLYLVETEDEGMIFCERIGADRIEMAYMESAPHAIVFTAVLERAQ